MKKLNVVLVLVGLLFVGCGGGVDSTPKKEVLAITDIVDTTKNYHIAQDNSIHDVNVTFGKFTVVVYTDALVETKSQWSKAIYGKIDGSATNALLTVNANYEDDTAFIIKVFKENKLVGESNKAIITGGTLEFSDITTK